MGLADRFMDAMASIDQLDAAPSLTRERRTELCSDVRENLKAIAERLAPSEDHDLDAATIIPSGDYLTIDEAQDREAALWAAAEKWHRRNRPGKCLVTGQEFD